MAENAKKLCLNLLNIFCLMGSILGDCSISFPEDPTLRPSYYKYIGSNKLKISTFKENYLNLHKEQHMEAHCDISFEKPTFYKGSNILYVRCEGNYIYTSTDFHHKTNINYYHGSTTLECTSFKWNLYESSQNFDWCPFNVTSYILAKPKRLHTTTSGYNYLAGMCYDIFNSSFRSVYYQLSPKETEYLQLLDLYYKPDLEIKYIKETFGSNSISENVYDDDQFVNWIAHSSYDFRLIIQHQELYSTFNDRFASLLQIVWWPNLRLYNWKRYVNALEKHVENDNKVYDILAGVSGAVKAPIIKSCQKNYTMEEVVFNTNRQIPLYVWNYLQDVDNTTNEMVIIGFNSPFYEFYSFNDIVFCPDKCQEISWLKEISSYFRYNVMGLISCCSVEDVRSSKHLYGFPENSFFKSPKPPQYNTSPLIFDETATELNENENV